MLRSEAKEVHKYNLCPRCKQYAIHLATDYGLEFCGDQDDNESNESIYADVEAPLTHDVSVFAHICFECGHLEDVGIESPRNKTVDTREYQWTADWPTESGAYWFYGWKTGCLERDPEMTLVAITAKSGYIFATIHGYALTEHVAVGLWSLATLPSAPSFSLRSGLVVRRVTEDNQC